MQDSAGHYTIAGKKYNLKVHGKSVCPKAFAALHGISFNTLSKLVTDDEDVPVETVKVQIHNNNK
jgi:hypothetical protein